MKDNQTITFASSVKEEIAANPRNNLEKRALLASFLKINGHVRLGNKTQIILDSESAQTAKLLYGFLHELYGVSIRFSYTRAAGFLKRVLYHVIVDDADAILKDLTLDPLGVGFPEDPQFFENGFAAFLAGAFLASGSVNDPNGSYHLEIRVADEGYAQWFAKNWTRAGGHAFTPKVAQRRNHYIIYLKRSEEIGNFLILVGAQEACFHYEDVRVARDYRNVSNRLQNLDTANMGKTLYAAERQLEEINFLEEKGLIEKFNNPKIRILCRLRKENPEVSLWDLADLLSQEIAATVSKSNINHLFREIHQTYEEARGE